MKQIDAFLVKKNKRRRTTFRDAEGTKQKEKVSRMCQSRINQIPKQVKPGRDRTAARLELLIRVKGKEMKETGCQCAMTGREG